MAAAQQLCRGGEDVPQGHQLELVRSDTAQSAGPGAAVSRQVGRRHGTISTRIGPHSWLGYNNIGWVLSAAGKVDQAIALALGREGHPDLTIAEYRRAILIEPKYLYAHWNLAAALQSQRDFDGAIGEYRSALDCTKDTRQRAILHTSVGDVLMDKAAGVSVKLDEAIVEYTRARHRSDLQLGALQSRPRLARARQAR